MFLKFYLWEIVCAVLIWIVTSIHAKRFADNQPITWTFHIFWSIPFAALIFLVFREYRDWWLVAALILERLSWYNIVLNKLRDKPIFYIGAQSKNEAWTDKIIELWSKNFALVFFVSATLWICVNVMKGINFLK